VLEGLEGLNEGDKPIVLPGSIGRAATSCVCIRAATRSGPSGASSAPAPPTAQSHRTPPVTILSIDGGRVRVRNLEALDRTPIIDVKPTLSSDISER
jgi:hypothetical protein